MIGRTFEQIEQRYQELRDRTLTERLPQGSSEWLTIFNYRLLDNIPAGVAFLDRDFILRKQNRTYADYLRLYSPVNPDNAIGKCYFDFIPGSEYQLADWFRETRDCSLIETQYDYELRLKSDTGEKLTFWDATISPVFNADGKTSGILIFCLDVTRRFKAIEAATELQNKFDQAKSTITTLLDLKEEVRADLEERLSLNASDLLLPLVERLQKSHLNNEQRHILTLIESTVLDITAKFSSKLNSPSFRLTPREILVAFLIKTGKTSKEIADMLTVSPASIEFHRANIRKKLGLTDSKINLRSFLLSL
jgi:DNA-binding CsgD family transcriptional regulator